MIGIIRSVNNVEFVNLLIIVMLSFLEIKLLFLNFNVSGIRVLIVVIVVIKIGWRCVVLVFNKVLCVDSFLFFLWIMWLISMIVFVIMILINISVLIIVDIFNVLLEINKVIRVLIIVNGSENKIVNGVRVLLNVMIRMKYIMVIVVNIVKLSCLNDFLIFLVILFIEIFILEGRFILFIFFCIVVDVFEMLLDVNLVLIFV